MCTVKVFLVSKRMRCSDPVADVALSQRRVRRKLFENELPPDSPRSGELLARIEEEIAEENRRTWNFDFRREVPLPGRYEWVPVGSGTPVIAETAIGGADVPVVHEVVRPEVKTGPAKVSAKQRKITDFMSQRKRARANDVSPMNKLRRLNSEGADVSGSSSEMTSAT